MKKLTTLILLALAVAGLSAQIKFDPARKVAYAAQIVENFYVDEIDTTRVVEEAIKGMLKTLDPHSVYSNAEETATSTSRSRATSRASAYDSRWTATPSMSSRP